MFDFDAMPQWDGDQMGIRLLELPQPVIFPHVFGQFCFHDPYHLLVLHEALETDGLIALGATGERGAIVCLCRIIAHEFFDDGSCLIMAVGLRRMRLLDSMDGTCLENGETAGFSGNPTNWESDTAGRVRAEICESACPFDEPEEHALLRQGLRDAVDGMLDREDEEGDGEFWEEQRHLLFSDELPLGSISDILASLFEFDLPEKRALLGETVVENRARRLIRGLACLRTERLYDRLLLQGRGGDTRNN